MPAAYAKHVIYSLQNYFEMERSDNWCDCNCFFTCLPIFTYIGTYTHTNGCYVYVWCCSYQHFNEKKEDKTKERKKNTHTQTKQTNKQNPDHKQMNKQTNET